MHFNRTTEYAIRVLYHLSQNRRELNTSDMIADNTGVSYPYVRRVLNTLKRSGLIGTEQGRNGGYLLVKNPEEITLLEIVELTEGSPRVRPCEKSEGGCDDALPSCRAADSVLAEMERGIETHLMRVTISDLHPDKRSGTDSAYIY